MDFLAASNVDPSGPAYLIGQYSWLIIGLIVVAVQLPKFKEAGRSKMATLGLILFWIGAGMMPLVGSFRDESSAVSTLLVGVLAVIAFGLMISSVVLAVIGLAKTFGEPEKRLTGRAAAIWTLSLGGLALMLGGYGFYTTLQARIEADRAMQVDASESQMQVDTDNAVTLVEDEEFNYRLELPGKGWLELDSNQINKEIVFLASNQRARANLMVIAEKMGFLEYDFGAIGAVIRQRALAVQAGGKGTEFYEAEIGGRKVRRMELEIPQGPRVLEFQFTLFAENGVLYQVITSHNGKGLRKKNREITEHILRSFETIDQGFAHKVSVANHVESVSSNLGGLSVPLSEGGWQEWDLIEEEADYAEDGALLGLHAGIELVATQEIDPSESQSAIDDMFLKAMDIDLDSVIEVRKKEAEIDGNPGMRYLILDDRNGGDFWFHVTSVKKGNLAVAVVIWWAKQHETPALRETLDATFERVLFTPERATKPDVYEAHQKVSQAILLNHLGLYHYARSRYSEAMGYFLRADELNDTYPVYLRNVLRAAFEGALTKKGLSFAQEHLDAIQADGESRALYAMILAQDGQFEPAEMEMKLAIKGGYHDSDDLLAIVNLFIDADRHDTATEVIRAVLAQGASEKYSTWLATVLRLGGQYDEAEKALENYINDGHISMQVGEELVATKIAQGLASDALELSKRMIKESPDSPRAIELKLDALIELNWLTEARETVQAALEQFPGNDSLTGYLEWLDSQLGVDDLSAVSKALEPVPLPNRLEGIAKQAQAAETPESWQEREVIFDYNITGYAFEPGKPVRKTIRKRVRINTRRAVEYFSTLDFSFSREVERLYVNRIEVFDDKGELVASAKRDSFYLSEQSDSEMASDETTLYAPVNGLAEGHVLEWEATWEDRFNSDEFPYFRHYSANAYPVFEFLQYVTGDVDGVEAVTSKVTSLDLAAEGSMAWRLANSPGTDFESNMPDYAEILPRVDLGSKKRNWEEITRGYLKEIQAQLAPDETMAAVVAKENLEGLRLREKVMHLVRLAQARLVYKALEFGATARIPDRATESWSNRYGDCKDQTIVILQLLKAAGIESYPLLVNTGSKLTPELPSLDQFNHMVIYVPALSDQPVIDLVDTEFDPAFGPPLGLGGRQALLCDENNPRLIQISEYPSRWGQPCAVVKCELKLDEKSGLIKVSESLSLSGYYGSWLRQSYLDIEPKDHRAQVENVLREYLPADSSINSVEISYLDDRSRPMTIDVEYTATAPEGALEYLPAWKGYYLDMNPTSGRKNPYRFTYPFSIESVVGFDSEKIILDGPEKDELKVSGIPRFEYLHSELEAESKRGESRYRIGWPATDLSVAEYYAFYDKLDQAIEAATRKLRINSGASGEL